MSDADFVPLRSFSSPVMAQMAADFLRDHGIACIASGQHAAGILTSAYPVEVLLSVPENELEAAREALEAFDRAPPGPVPGG